VPKKFRPKINFAIALALASCVVAQSFEVATVTPSKPTGKPMPSFMRGGPGSKDPELLTAENFPLKFVVARAWDLPDYRLVAPDWMNSEKYSIKAKVPKDATKEQFRVMLQNLLLERFRMQVHFEKRELPLYELTVAKGGAKLKPSTADASPSPQPPPTPRKMAPDSEGYPTLRPGGTSFAVIGDHWRAQWINEPVAELVSHLSVELHAPVIDKTGLDGKYDIVLSWVDARGTEPARNDGSTPVVASDPGGPTIEAAVLSQLGLKLEKKKGPVEVLVVDDARKIPTEN
jgi:uncharacterized protein (TIGR03435 family)